MTWETFEQIQLSLLQVEWKWVEAMFLCWTAPEMEATIGGIAKSPKPEDMTIEELKEHFKTKEDNHAKMQL